MTLAIVEHLQDVVSDKPCAALAIGLLATVGLFKLTLTALSFVKMILDVAILPAPNYRKYGANRKNADSAAWAIVTGCTQGIGEQFVHQFAAKGFNVGLVSRTESKLQALKEVVEAKYKVHAKVLAFDVAEDQEVNYMALRKFAEELGIVGVLVNNVGVSHSIPVPFMDTSDEELRDIINVNNIGTLKITQAVVPQIQQSVADKKIKKGLILNLGSFAGLTPTPLLATYSGSKAFLQAWSNALARELAPSGIDVQFYIAYLVTSAMSKIRRSSLLIPNPRQFVRSCLQAVGRNGGAQDRYSTATPYWSHAVFHWFIHHVPGEWSKTVVDINYKMHKDIRRRALNKASRNQKKSQEKAE